MPDTASLLGGSVFSFGPGNFYFDTASGGSNTNLGDFDQLVIAIQTKKIELKSAQKGDRAADKAVSSQNTMVTIGMAQATLERLSIVQQGFTLDYNSDGSIRQYFMSDVVGQRDSSVQRQCTFVEIVDGVEAWADPFRVVDIWAMAPLTESAELTFDATTQRYYPVQFEAYASEDHLDQNGRKTYWASRAMIV